MTAKVENITINASGHMIETTSDKLAGWFKENQPDWAAKAIAADIMADTERDVDTPINLTFEQGYYEVIWLDEAIERTNIGGFNANDYSDASSSDDEGDLIDSWLNDITSELDGFVAKHGNLMSIEFLVKRL